MVCVCVCLQNRLEKDCPLSLLYAPWSQWKMSWSQKSLKGQPQSFDGLPKHACSYATMWCFLDTNERSFSFKYYCEELRESNILFTVLIKVGFQGLWRYESKALEAISIDFSQLLKWGTLAIKDSSNATGTWNVIFPFKCDWSHKKYASPPSVKTPK